MRFLEFPAHGPVFSVCKMFHGQIIWGKCRLKQRHASQPQVFGYYVHGTWSEKGASVWGGLAWASGLSGILALLPFSSWIFQQSMYYRRALWILWGPSLSCQQSLLPGHEGISLFSLRPHASFHMAYLAPPIILWVLLQRLWNLIFAPGSLCWPLQELISIDVALSVSNKGQNSQSRPLWSSYHSESSSNRYPEIASQNVWTLCLALGVNLVRT